MKRRETIITVIIRMKHTEKKTETKRFIREISGKVGSRFAFFVSIEMHDKNIYENRNDQVREFSFH